MKTLYWNGVSDVQISKETKKNSKRIGTARISEVFNAKQQGELVMVSGHGIKKSEWDRFMVIHSSESNTLKSELQQVAAI
jgi:hypothetical protein